MPCQGFELNYTVKLNIQKQYTSMANDQHVESKKKEEEKVKEQRKKKTLILISQIETISSIRITNLPKFLL